MYTKASNKIEGIYTNTDNVIAVSSKDGEEKARFILISAFQTTEAMEKLCDEFNNAIEQAKIVRKYVSIEMLIEKTKETYYEALQNSSIEWHNNKSDYTSFVRYYLGILLKGYNEFQDRIKHLKYRK